MPFMVGAGGVVQEKNLGHNTAVLAKAMVACNPDSSWRHGKSLEPSLAAVRIQSAAGIVTIVRTREPTLAPSPASSMTT